MFFDISTEGSGLVEGDLQSVNRPGIPKVVKLSSSCLTVISAQFTSDRSADVARYDITEATMTVRWC
jgi:hypothetical protein